MKRIVFLFTVTAVLCVGCATYPHQSEYGRKDVPATVGFFTEMPVVNQIEDLKWIHDVSNNSFILFKGAADSILTDMQSYLKDNDGQLVMRLTETPIAPFTLFTRDELNAMDPMNKKKVRELAGYKTTVITVIRKTTVTQLSPEDLVKFNGAQGIKPPQATTTPVQQNRQQQTQPAGSSPWRKESKPQQRR